jgi:hypothetical protein
MVAPARCRAQHARALRAAFASRESVVTAVDDVSPPNSAARARAAVVAEQTTAT